MEWRPVDGLRDGARRFLCVMGAIPIAATACAPSPDDSSDVLEVEVGSSRPGVVFDGPRDATAHGAWGSGLGESTRWTACRVGAGTWTSCPIDRRIPGGYDFPPRFEPQVTPSVADETSLNATLGNLAGHDGDGWVYSDFPSATHAPGFLCLQAGEYTACPDSLALPELSGPVTVMALEDFDGDGRPDMVIGELDTRGADMDTVAALAAQVPPVPVDFVLHFYSQEAATSPGTVRWRERTTEVGLEPFPTTCLLSNIQAADLDGDGAPELIIGGVGCQPVVLQPAEGRVTRRDAWLPTPSIAPDTKTGVFVGPVDATGSRSVFLMNYGLVRGGTERLGTSTCWYGRPGNWESYDCPSWGTAPMGMTLFDPDQDGLLDAAASDLRTVRICTHNSSFAKVVCFDESWKVPTSQFTLAGDPWFTVSWGAASWDNKVAFAASYENAIANEPGTVLDGVRYYEWPQQLLLFETNDFGETYSRVHLGGVDDDAQERGLFKADVNDDGCMDLIPLPMANTALRVLLNGTCASGAQTVAFRDRRFPAYGALVTLIRRHPSTGSELRQAQMVTSGGGWSGFGPPTVAVSADVLEIEVLWTTGQSTRHVRTAGRFPSTISRADP